MQAPNLQSLVTHHSSLITLSRPIMTLNPDTLICANFLFPNGDNFLQPVNPVTSRVIDTLVAVTGCTGNKGCQLANLQAADALGDSNPLHQRPALPNLLGNLRHL